MYGCDGWGVVFNAGSEGAFYVSIMIELAFSTVHGRNSLEFGTLQELLC